MGDALPTVSLGTAETAVEVTAASQHTCALLGSGGVKCWGRGFFGNLGLDSYKARCAFVRVLQLYFGQTTVVFLLNYLDCPPVYLPLSRLCPSHAMCYVAIFCGVTCGVRGSDHQMRLFMCSLTWFVMPYQVVHRSLRIKLSSEIIPSGCVLGPGRRNKAFIRWGLLKSSLQETIVPKSFCSRKLLKCSHGRTWPEIGR